MSENDLSRKIRDLRALHGLTLEQVAQQVGVGRSTVRKWETGLIANMRRDKIAKLATALHTTPGYLMGWEDDPDSAGSEGTDNSEKDGRNLIRIAARDGSYRERVLTDEQLAALTAILDQMPDASDDL